MKWAKPKHRHRGKIIDAVRMTIYPVDMLGHQVSNIPSDHYTKVVARCDECERLFVVRLGAAFHIPLGMEITS